MMQQVAFGLMALRWGDFCDATKVTKSAHKGCRP